MGSSVPRKVLVRGSGIAGLWQALLLADAGHTVTLCGHSDRDRQASWYAGAMLAPWCERESAEPIIVTLGMRSLEIWKQRFAGTISNGSLVVATARDGAELERFEQATEGFEKIERKALGDLEPDLDGRFSSALYFPGEAHVETRTALAALEQDVRDAGVEIQLSNEPGVFDDIARASDAVIDCTGLGARSALPDLRGVRGEMVLIRSHDVHLSRPVRLAHPRFPVYLVPWKNNDSTTTYMVGATMIEREGDEPVRVRSAIDLLGAAYAIHPGLGEAEIIELGSGVRPAFSDNIPKVVLRDDAIYVNGMFRHGFLLAPALAELVVRYLDTGERHAEIFVDHCLERQT